jgi:hypothetical protein
MESRVQRNYELSDIKEKMGSRRGVERCASYTSLPLSKADILKLK